MSSVINWFDIPAVNFDRAVKFYETVLGLSLIRENVLGAQMGIFPAKPGEATGAILARDGVVEPNLVWSDTVLVRTGETLDIVLEVTNVGRWMAHCHIAEHHESGMMLSFDVAPAAASSA